VIILKKTKKLPPNTARIDNNIILADDVAMSLDDYTTNRNLNVLLAGGPGTGKTRGVLIPNLLNANTSFCITDPKGEILSSCGTLLKRLGYKIKVFNLDDMKHSSNYNPFNYVYDRDGHLDYNAVKKMITVLMKNVAGGNKNKNSSADPFWDVSAEKLITAISILLLEEGAKSQQNFAAVAEKMRAIEFPSTPEESKNFKSTLDKEFDTLEAKNPDSLGVLLYREFKQGAGKTMKSVISVANSKLQDFNLPDVKSLTHRDSINLDMLGDELTALFVIIPTSDTSFNFLAAMMYTQMFDILLKRAYRNKNKRLKIPVRCLLDEFANCGQIPDFENVITVIRSAAISVTVIIQAVSQLEALYEKSWRTIEAGCDSFIFLGSQEDTTLKLVSERLGKETIDIVGHNRTRGWHNNSMSDNNSLHGRELLTPDEVAKMNNDYCILFVRGYNPFYSKKYKLETHPNYIYTAQFNPENAYDCRDFKTVPAPKLTRSEKAEKRRELHRETADINAVIKREIKAKKIKEISLSDGIVLKPQLAQKVKTFDTRTPEFKEKEIAEIAASKGGALFDLDFSFSDGQNTNNDYY